MTLIIAILLFLLCPEVMAQPIFRLHSGEEIAEIRKNATLVVESYTKGIISDDATAFWIGNEGYLVTSYHAIQKSLKDKDIEVRIFDRQNNRIEYTVVACGDDRKIDLCLLKSPTRPKAYFPIQKTKIGEGHTTWWIGHTNLRSYTAKESKILRFYTDTTTQIIHGDKTRTRLKNFGVASVAHTNPQCKGCSGGPLFDSSGYLVGMLDRIYHFPKATKKPDINLAISADEIFEFYEKNKTSK